MWADKKQFVTIEQTTGAAGGAATITLAAVTGFRHAITNIFLMRGTGTAETPAGATVSVTTTNLPGSMAWTVGNNIPVGGTQTDVNLRFCPPLLANASGTSTTIVMGDPGTNPVWTGQVAYYLVAEL
jgi:hypothetical protein